MNAVDRFGSAGSRPKDESGVDSRRRRECNDLECELASEEGRQLLREFNARRSHYAGGAFGCWKEVARSLRQAEAASPNRDGILLAVVAACAGVDKRLLARILLYLLHASLREIHERKRHWDRDRDELWQELILAFLEEAVRLPSRSWQDRIANRLLGAVTDRLYERYARRWRERDRVALRDPIQATDWTPRATEPEADALGRVASDVAVLREACAAGVIGEAEIPLLLWTSPRESSLAEFARGHGFDYEVLRKRRQRAIAALRTWQAHG